MITVFYDGKCSLCSKEINIYKNHAISLPFKWVDITSTPHELTQHDFSITEGLKKLHAMDGQGHFHIGVDAFILIWRNIPQWRFLAHIVDLPLIKQCANFLYTSFANWRYKKLNYCELSLDQ